jgi:hypothetical protein
VGDDNWRRLKDPGKIEDAAREALKQHGREPSFVSSELAVPRHARATHTDCDELWCVKIKESETEIRECMAVNDGREQMVKKFARAFGAVFGFE